MKKYKMLQLRKNAEYDELCKITEDLLKLSSNVQSPKIFLKTSSNELINNVTDFYNNRYYQKIDVVTDIPDLHDNESEKHKQALVIKLEKTRDMPM